MDDEFNTICEDDSTDEVGMLLWEFYKHCLSGDREVVESEIAKLPTNANWLSKCVNQSSSANGDDVSNQFISSFFLHLVSGILLPFFSFFFFFLSCRMMMTMKMKVM